MALTMVLASCAALVLLLAGCAAAGPDYRRPARTLPAQHPVPVSDAGTAAADAFDNAQVAQLDLVRNRQARLAASVDLFRALGAGQPATLAALRSISP